MKDHNQKTRHYLKYLSVAFLAIFCPIVIAISVSSSAAFKNEPDGFRGHKWGSWLETFGEMEKLDNDYPIYKKVDEELTMGGVEVESIVYFFEEDQFNMAQVVFNSKRNFRKLKKILESQHGRSTKDKDTGIGGAYEAMTGLKHKPRNRYWWVKGPLSLHIEYFKDDKKGQIMYFYELPGDCEKGLAAFLKQDYIEARKYFNTARCEPLEKANKAKGLLGYMYEMGLGVEQDYKEAVKFYREASIGLKGTDAFAQFRLGAMYENGHGIERDYEWALRWYRKAADQNLPGAQEALKRLEGN